MRGLLFRTERFMPRLFNPYQYLKADFDPSEIKVIDLPNDATFSPRAYVGIDQLSRRLPPEETQAIAKAWKQTLNKESLVDDTILSVRFLNRTDGSFVLSSDQYKVWKATANKDFYAQFGSGYIPNLLKVQILAETTDHQIVLETRPLKDGEELALRMPGGVVSPDDKWAPFTSSRITPESGAVRRLYEEVGCVPRHISYLGASFYAGRVITTLYYTAELAVTAAELTQYRQDNRDIIKGFDEFPQEYYVPATDAGIRAARQTGRLRETAEVGLLLKGRELLGPAWFNRNCPARMRE